MSRSQFRYRPIELTGAEPGTPANAVRAQNSTIGATITDLTSPEAAEFLRGGMPTHAGATVTMQTALKVGAAWRCLHLIAGVCGNLPIDLMKRVDERQREPAVGHPVRKVLTEAPNGWQTPAEFRKMLTAHAVMKGNGYALKIMSRGRLLALWPMNPDRVELVQRPDMSLAYAYTRADGQRITLEQADVLHLRGLTWDGIKGVGVLQYAREAMGLSLQTEKAGAQLFRQGMIGGKIFSKEGTLKDEAFERLRAQIDEAHAGAENAHKTLILEDGLKSDGELMTAADMQFLGIRDFQRTDVCMFFGVPPHMAGIVDKSTSFGTGIEQQSTGFIQYTADDWFVMWEQSIARDLLSEADRAAGLYARINRAALTRGDIRTRWAAHVQSLQWGVASPNEVRALEDMNPREGGDVFYDPPNTPGDKGQDTTSLEPPPVPVDNQGNPNP